MIVDTEKWSVREVIITFGVILALIPVLAIIEGTTGASAGTLAVAYWAVTVAVYAALRPSLNRDLGAVLFAVYIVCGLRAVMATADFLDVWEGWVMLAVVAPYASFQWLRDRRRRREGTPA